MNSLALVLDLKTIIACSCVVFKNTASQRSSRTYSVSAILLSLGHIVILWSSQRHPSIHLKATVRLALNDFCPIFILPVAAVQTPWLLTVRESA